MLQTLPTHPFNSSSYNGIIEKTLWFFNLEENIKITTVCKNWKEIVGKVIYWRERNGLECKMAPFLRITGGSVADYCKGITENLPQLSARKVHFQFTELTKKHNYQLHQRSVDIHLNLNDCWMFDQASSEEFRKLSRDPINMGPICSRLKRFETFNAEDPLEVQSRFLKRVDKMIGRVFIGCTYAFPSMSVKLNIDGFCDFPVSLFNLDLQGEDPSLSIQSAIGQTYCFPIHDTLHELFIVGTSPRLNLLTYKPVSVTHKSACIVQALVGPYIPELDAKALATLSHVFNSTICSDAIQNTFRFLNLEENIKITTVCKNWKKEAYKVIKLQICFKEQRALALKMAPFLRITGDNVANYCKEITENLPQLSPQEVHSRFKTLTIKHEMSLEGAGTAQVSLGDCWMFDQESLKDFQSLSLDPENKSVIHYELKKLRILRTEDPLEIQSQFLERVNKSIGRVFVDCLHVFPKNIWKIYIKEFCEFPVSLFNIEMQGKDHELALAMQSASGKSYCFPVHGDLHEFFITKIVPPGNPHSVKHRSASITGALLGRYIPELDAARPKGTTKNKQ